MKVARTVLRRGGASNRSSLFDPGVGMGRLRDMEQDFLTAVRSVIEMPIKYFRIQLTDCLRVSPVTQQRIQI
jgi:hypothetical protein